MIESLLWGLSGMCGLASVVAGFVSGHVAAGDPEYKKPTAFIFMCLSAVFVAACAAVACVTVLYSRGLMR